MRFYFDQHVPGAVAVGLRQNGLEVLTTQEAGRCGLNDPDQLAYSTSEDRVMVTFDTDFLALHRSGVSHGGIAWCPAAKYRTGQLVRMLVLLHSLVERDAMTNHVEYL